MNGPMNGRPPGKLIEIKPQTLEAMQVLLASLQGESIATVLATLTAFGANVLVGLSDDRMRMHAIEFLRKNWEDGVQQKKLHWLSTPVSVSVGGEMVRH